MNIKYYSNVIALPVLMLGAFSAAAATQEDALQACAIAIASSIEATQGAEVKLRVDSSGIRSDRRLRTSGLFYMDAVDPATNTVVGRYDCVVNRRAIVRSLNKLSADAPSAENRADGE